MVVKRILAAIPVAVGGVTACTIGTLLIISGLHGLLAASGILLND